MELHAQGLCSLNFFLMRNIFVFEMCGREPSIIIIDILLKCTHWTLCYSTHGSPRLSMTLRWLWYMERVGTDDLPKGLSTRTTLRSVFDMVYLNLSLPESSLVWSGHPVTLSFVPIAKS